MYISYTQLQVNPIAGHWTILVERPTTPFCPLGAAGIYPLILSVAAISFFYFPLYAFYGMFAVVLRRTSTHATVNSLPHCGVAGTT
jgi:hypothetical protein